MGDLNATVGSNIRRFREREGRSQAWLADKLECSELTVKADEAGKRNIDLRTGGRICTALNCTIDELVATEAA
jgi:DNA-binding XRE family transcriptional regulator